ncbi:hypothetical protein Lalb_Chr06g0176001 [Lupinus albus]|uniref:Uncharacterized protein n=1 Tax=Lupinus albus TaxID=3870 RepID=A0A6A4QHL2_LUPAL|nr:hypothetical protein Lalb_Chr06g0176001 [Lupinus albus]
MQKEEEKEKEKEKEYLTCPSFSTYSSNNLANIADQLTQNDNHIHLNDDNSFEFVSLPSDQLFFNGGGWIPGDESDSLPLQFQMRNLLISDEDHRRDSPSSSSSSSEVVELDGIPASTYCVWTPKSAQSVQASPNRCKKSNSTGSSASPSKRWKVLDLLRRSNSDGKNTFLPETTSALEALYLGKRERRMKEKEKRKTYLPYKQHLIGYSSAFNSFPPF